MPLTAGTRLGPYEIQSPLGAGGMGEVYRARDTRLDRAVAIKILPEALAADPQFLERFDREARTISQLDHPHICALYDVGEQSGTAYLVMQYLEGQTLADRLEQGALPVAEALTIAIQIAAALDAAHRAGIVHRDLKPGNVMLTKVGAKLLDFGLAKASAPVVAAAGLSMAPTMGTPVTAQGTILGTFQYMAPEQLEGKDADARTDIFAFGAVLYEMLTGRKAFEGKSHASLVAAILEREPAPVSTLQPLTPPALGRLVRKCLAKDPDARWQTTRDLHDELQWVRESPVPKDAGSAAVTSARYGQRSYLWPSVAAACFTAAITLAVLHIRETAPVAPVVTFDVPLPEGTTLAEGAFLAMSPDGSTLALSVRGVDGKSFLWIRRLDSAEPQRLSGTDNAAFPFWSADSRSIGFFADRSIKRIDLSGSTPLVICKVTADGRATWNQKGDILFSVGGNSPIYRVAAGGGTPQAVTMLEANGEVRGHAWPQFLPDGDHFVFLELRDGSFRAAIGSLASEAAKPLMAVDSAVFYAAPGYLMFLRQRNLMAQPFDLASLETSGEAVRIAPGPGASPIGSISTSVSQNGGVLVNRVSGDEGNELLVWYERSGRMAEQTLEPGLYRNPSLSWDGRRVALERRLASQAEDVWVLDSRGVLSRITSHGAPDMSPRWSPDDRWLYFSRGTSIYRTAAGGGSDEELVFDDAKEKRRLAISSISPDGRLALLVGNRGLNPSASDIWIVPLPGGTPSALIATEFNETDPRFSPDGHWVAYVSNQSGRDEIYVRPYPPTGEQWQVSTGGGTQPRWRPDGRELFYTVGPTLMAVPVETAKGFEPGVTQALFELPVRILGYDVGRNGEQFLMNYIAAVRGSAISVTVNWPGLLNVNRP